MVGCLGCDDTMHSAHVQSQPAVAVHNLGTEKFLLLTKFQYHTARFYDGLVKFRKKITITLPDLILNSDKKYR
jgi:hypothetical protein